METINMEILFQRSFPMSSKNHGRTVKLHQLFSHASFPLKTDRNLIVLFKTFFAFYVPNFQVCVQMIFHVKLRQILLKSVGAFFI